MSRARDIADIGEDVTSLATDAELSSGLAEKVNYSTPVNEQTGTSYTFELADARKLTTASSASAVTLTIPPQSEVTWEDDTILRVVNYGAGAVTVAGGSGVTVTNTASTIGQYESAAAIRTDSDAWTLVPFGGGEIPAAEISSPSATGQYTDGNGDTWDYYRFTASGTLTVDTAGFADILVIGGGGGGAQVLYTDRGGGGGGAGGLFGKSIQENFYLDTGSYSVIIGAGGSQQSAGSYSACGALIGDGGNGGTVAGPSTFGNGGNAGGSLTVAQGFVGASGTGVGSAGGGGGVAGAGAVSSGGAGLSSNITGSSVTYGVGGPGSSSGNAGTANTGNGGQGRQGSSGSGGAGGSGVVVVRVKV